MKVFNVDQNIHEFLQFVATNKKALMDWQFFHAVIRDPDQKLQIDEVEQLLQFQLQTDKACLLKMPASNEVLLFTPKSETLALAKIEKAIYENFSSDILRARFRGFDSDGLEQFSKIIAPHVKQDDVIARVAFKRMSRPGNSILVLDDDIMVLKQMEKVLSGLGNVVTLQKEDEFTDSYRKHAPDILFLDIHLRTAKGNELLRELKKSTDPFAHVIMISSDTKEDIILDIKQGGAKGFVVKPFNRNALLQHVTRAPTFGARAA